MALQDDLKEVEEYQKRLRERPHSEQSEETDAIAAQIRCLKTLVESHWNFQEEYRKGDVATQAKLDNILSEVRDTNGRVRHLEKETEDQEESIQHQAEAIRELHEEGESRERILNDTRRMLQENNEKGCPFAQEMFRQFNAHRATWKQVLLKVTMYGAAIATIVGILATLAYLGFITINFPQPQ